MSSLPTGKTLVAVKGAPETIKGMLATVPAHYDETYKSYTRMGSRVLALGAKEMDTMGLDKASLAFWSIIMPYAYARFLDQQAFQG